MPENWSRGWMSSKNINYPANFTSYFIYISVIYTNIFIEKLKEKTREKQKSYSRILFFSKTLFLKK